MFIDGVWCPKVVWCCMAVRQGEGKRTEGRRAMYSTRCVCVWRNTPCGPVGAYLCSVRGLMLRDRHQCPPPQFSCKCKGKGHPRTGPWRHSDGVEVWIYPFFNLGGRCGEWCSGKDPVPIVQETGWAPGLVWTGTENLASPGFDPRTVQPVATRCTPLPQFLRAVNQVNGSRLVLLRTSELLLQSGISRRLVLSECCWCGLRARGIIA